MFCTRCGQAVGQTDRVCATCDNDLSRSGAIRLTDPALLGDAESGPPAEWFRDQRKPAPAAAPVPFEQQQPAGQPAPAAPTAATWKPPPPPTPVSYPDVDYVPKPDPGMARNSAVMLALIGLVVLALVLVVAVAIRFLRPDNAIVVIPSASGSAAPSSQGASSEPAPTDTTDASPSDPSGSPSLSGASMPAGVTECTPTVGAGPNTSCEFALNVAGAVDQVDPAEKSATFQVVAKSPVTGQSYTMSCSPSGPMIVCVGGNSASVYLI